MLQVFNFYKLYILFVAFQPLWSELLYDLFRKKSIKKWLFWLSEVLKLNISCYLSDIYLVLTLKGIILCLN